MGSALQPQTANFESKKMLRSPGMSLFVGSRMTIHALYLIASILFRCMSLRMMMCTGSVDSSFDSSLSSMRLHDLMVYNTMYILAARVVWKGKMCEDSSDANTFRSPPARDAQSHHMSSLLT
jgi:hypothetical protein